MPTGPQLRVARIARGLTLGEAARAAGVGLATLSRIENGRATLQPDVEARLMRIVDWTTAFDRLFADLAAAAPPPPAPPGAEPHAEPTR